MGLAEEIKAIAELAGVEAAAVKHFVYVSEEHDIQEAGAPTATDPLFEITVETGKCLLVQRIDADSYPVDGAGSDLYSHRQRNLFNEGVKMWIEINDVEVVPATTPARLLLGDFFLLVPAGKTVSFCVTIPAGGDRMKASFRVHAFLLPQRAFNALETMQTQIG